MILPPGLGFGAHLCITMSLPLALKPILRKGALRVSMNLPHSIDPPIQGTCLHLQAVQEGDTPFLMELYASTREGELNSTGWDSQQRQTFVEMQFRLREAHYRLHFPQSRFDLVVKGEERIGSIRVQVSDIEFRVVDIALLPAHQGQGYGSLLLRQVQSQAAEARLPVRLHVVLHSDAIKLYERLGFRSVQTNGCYLGMEWIPG